MPLQRAASSMAVNHRRQLPVIPFAHEDYPMVNHGLLSVGETVGEAFVWIYRIETACRLQIDALSGGAELNPLSAATQQKSIETGLKMYDKGGFNEVGREWAALVRQLERLDGTGYQR